jgi:prepilin-type N-terminal cleavage/methylation domain-containing protein
MKNNVINARRGFTLIELLVVIAIIGILSAVVLASLQTARNKGTDGAIKSDLAAIQTQAELYYDSNGNKYASANDVGGTDSCVVGTSMFGADPTIKAAVAAATSSISGASNTPIAVRVTRRSTWW